MMTGLFAWFTNAIRDEQGDVNFGGSIGLFAFVIIILFILWLTESSGKTNFFD